MEIAYIVAGKRFKARDLKDLHKQLVQNSLISNLDSDGCGSLTVRRINDPSEYSRYEMIQTRGDSADFSGYDICIGKLVGTTSKDDIITSTPSELETILNEVRQDIPDASIIGGSYWA